MKIRKFLVTLFIWMVCFVAITSSAVLVYEWYHNRGVMIGIQFEDASGLVPHQSKIIYLGVQIGIIQEILMDLESHCPIVTARITTEIAGVLGPKSKFWIVRPQFSLGNIANLSTLLTGDYIAIQPVPGEQTKQFVGLEQGPIDQIISNDLTITLSTTNATGLSIGSPISFRGVEIGKINEITISKNLQTAILSAHIEKEYKNVIRKGSTFANVSGFHASLHLFGSSKVNMDSFKTLISGGINVYNFQSNSPVAKNGDSFKLLTNEQFDALTEQ